MSAGELINEKRKQELEWVNVEEHYEQQGGIERYGNIVAQTISTEKLVLIEPNKKEQHEADQKRSEAVHRFSQFIECLRHFKRNNQQSNCKREHGIAQAFNARNLVATPAKVSGTPDVLLN